jgi:DnaJ-class molecular chaperone
MPRLVERNCGFCDGTGQVEVGDFVKSLATCPVCKGHGKVRVPSNYRKCPICGGTGKKNVGEFFAEWVRCRTCDGTGWTEPPPAYT